MMKVLGCNVVVTKPTQFEVLRGNCRYTNGLEILKFDGRRYELKTKRRMELS
jgi:hypothetical protein